LVQPLLVYVNGNHGRTERSRDLNSESTDTTGANNHSDIVWAKTGSANRFIWSCHRVRYDRKHFERQPTGKYFRDSTKSSGGNYHMCCESAVAIVSGHELMAADSRATS
jgi:hypothetical protein